MVRSLRFLVLPPLMLRRAVAGIVTLPPPLNVPPVQVDSPPRTTSPIPFRVPPLRLKAPLRKESAAMESDPPETTRASSLSRLWMEVAPWE